MSEKKFQSKKNEDERIFELYFELFHLKLQGKKNAKCLQSNPNLIRALKKKIASLTKIEKEKLKIKDSI